MANIFVFTAGDRAAIKAREQEEFEARLAEIEEALETQRGDTTTYGSAG